MPIKLRCEDCGLPYEKFGVDLVLPDQQWEKIAGDALLLCANCVCKRAEKFNATALLTWVDNMDYAVEAAKEPEDAKR